MSAISDGIGDDGLEQLDENLRKWFKEKWVRFGPDGKIRGPCARGSESEGKPKCLPQSKAHSIGKKGRKYAAAKKRREDPNPERRGPAKNVATKKKSNEEVQVNEKWSQKYKDSINCSNPKGFSQKAHCAGKKKNEDMNEARNEYCPECGGSMYPESMINEKKDACYYKVKSRYKVWPSAYASGALVKCRKKGADNWGTGGKKNESSIMKGIVDEAENVNVIYVDGKPAAKYAYEREAQQDANRLMSKFPDRKIEIRKEVRGGIGGNEKLGEAGSPAQQAAIAIAMKKAGKKPKNEGVIVGHDKDDPEVAVLGGAGTMSLSRLKKKAHGEALQLADDISNGKYSASSYNMKQLHNTLNTIVAAEEEMKKKYFGEDYTGEFAAEKTAAVNPYGGQKDRQFRGAISETPTDNPTGASGEGGWRKYKPKSAGEIEEGQIYSTGGGAGQSYRKFKPKSAGTFNEDELDEACWKGYHKEGNKKMFGKTYPNCVKNTNEEEQLDEKCWDTHKQVGMKNKGGKQVPNCVPKESAIMKGLKR